MSIMPRTIYESMMDAIGMRVLVHHPDDEGLVLQALAADPDIAARVVVRCSVFVQPGNVLLMPWVEETK